MFTQELQKIGLTKNEAKLYIALLELEVASANEISTHTGIKRGSVYPILESLQKQGLVNMSPDGSVAMYVAVSPEFLLNMTEKAAKESAETRDLAVNMLTDLKSEFINIKEKPKITIFEGKEDLIKAFDDSIENNKEKILRFYAASNVVYNYFPEYIATYLERLYTYKITRYSIHPSEKVGIDLMEVFPPPPEYNFIAFIPADKYKFLSSIAIYDNKVSLASHEDDFAIIIDSKEIADVMKTSFDLGFEEAKRLNTYKK